MLLVAVGNTQCFEVGSEQLRHFFYKSKKTKLERRNIWQTKQVP